MQLIAVEQMGVHQRGKQIVRRGDGVKVAGEVKIDLRAGLNLRKPAAGRAAFHPKNGAERRLAGSDNHLLANMGKALRQTDSRDGFAFARGGRRCGRDDDELAPPHKSGIREQFEANFAAVRANLLEIFFRNSEFAGYRLNREKSICHRK